MTGLQQLRQLRSSARLLTGSQGRSGWSRDASITLTAPMHPLPDDLYEINDHQRRDDT